MSNEKTACARSILADVWPTITRVGAKPEAGRGLARAGSTARRHAGSTAWWRAGSTRVAKLKLDRPIVRVLKVHYDGGVSRYHA